MRLEEFAGRGIFLRGGLFQPEAALYRLGRSILPQIQARAQIVLGLCVSVLRGGFQPFQRLGRVALYARSGGIELAERVLRLRIVVLNGGGVDRIMPSRARAITWPRSAAALSHSRARSGFASMTSPRS